MDAIIIYGKDPNGNFIPIICDENGHFLIS